MPGRIPIVRPLLGLAGFLVDRLADDPPGDLGEVAHQRLVQGLELGPEHVIEEALGAFDRHCGPPLARVAKGLKAVAPGQGQEELARPGIADAEADLDVPGLLARLVQPGPDPLARRIGGQPLARGRGPGKERLDLAQPLAKFGFDQRCAFK